MKTKDEIASDVLFPVVISKGLSDVFGDQESYEIEMSALCKIRDASDQLLNTLKQIAECAHSVEHVGFSLYDLQVVLLNIENMALKAIAKTEGGGK